ncbi:response regulator transcription factor [Corynebacterium hindlerae]|uniref:Response regulator transcription factor n=1 Tax=Corynebacterium hindlerae TaxID=699041 RepID=A0A7G5FFZ7_9CORY|nr:response regulator transcription factor [Corynebacterium hindlerae]QMV85538.1 response regulator transcription factor [Corynebacterium hindlerae]
MISVLLADDHPVIRAGLKAVLEDDDDITVVGEVATPEEAVSFVRAHPDLDLVLMDLRFGDGPGEDAESGGVRATRMIREQPNAPQVLVVTNYSTDADVVGAVSAGAVGYLLKDSDPSVLVAGVRQAAVGESVLSTKVATRLMGRMRNPSVNLTAREMEVLRLVSEGKSNRDIAKELFLTEATIKSHLGNAFTKLGVTSRTAAVVEARKRGIF